MFNKILIFVSLWLRIFFPSHLLQDFYLWFSVVENDMHRCILLKFILLDVLWVSWISSLVSDIKLGKFSVIIVSNKSSVSFSDIIWYFYYEYVTLFLGFSQSLYIFCYFYSLYSFCFLRIPLVYPLTQKFSSAMSNLMISPSKVFFISITVIISF